MKIDPVSRVNYFSGEALLTQDFQVEQNYHMQMRERLSQGLLIPGILEGFDVEWTHSATEVTVKTGKAVDLEGRLIVLTQDTPYVPTLIGTQNFLTVSFDPELADHVTNPYGDGYKRWVEKPLIACSETYDPDGPAILLAVIAASGGTIQSIYYYYGNYMRRHVGATVQSIEFVDERNTRPWSAASIALNQDALQIEAPTIELKGDVTADSLSAAGTFSGVFDGLFVGDGSLLRLPPSTNYWTREGRDNIYYTAGNVAIGDQDASVAHLTVRGQSDAQSMVATGLISLEDDGESVTGYQTRFKSELKVGQIIAYDFVPSQAATIVSVVSNTEVVIDRRLAIDLGPAFFSIQHESTTTQGGAAQVTADGTTLTCTGGTFPAGVVAGDKIILNQSDENNPKLLRIKSIQDDTHLTVVGMSPAMAAKGGPKLSAFSAIQSVLLVAGGANPAVATLPPALAVAQNGSGAPMPNSIGINVESGALDGSYALDVQGAIKVARWPADATDASLMMTVGATPALPYDGLSVTDNGAIASVHKTVAINVDIIDPSYALDVKGPFRATSLDLSSGSFGIGTLSASSAIETDKIGPFTPNGSIEVTNDLTIDTAIKGSGTNPLTVAGDLEVKRDATIDGTLTVTGKISGPLKSPIPGPLDIDAPFRVLNGGNTVLNAGANRVTVSVDLYTQGALNVSGPLTTNQISINRFNAQGNQVFAVSDDGDVHMLGSFSVGTSPADSNFQVSPDGEVAISVSGKLSVGNDFEVAGDGKITVNSNGVLLVGAGFEASGSGDVTINSGGNFLVNGGIDISSAESVRCFGAVSEHGRYSVNFNGSSFAQATALTDGFIIVDVTPELAIIAGSAEVVATITGVGQTYECRTAINQISGSGRGGGSVTIPVPKGGICTFTAKTTAGQVPQLWVSVMWVPFGAGGLG